MSTVTLTDISKTFPDGTEALKNLTLEVASGSLVVMVGPSGCGKTTALRIVAGLERATSGALEIGGEDVGYIRAKDRDVAMVFQNYALYPNMTTEQNMGFSLMLRGIAKADRQRRVLEAARILSLEELLGRRPSELSGGQRQRVAMGRAIVRRPSVFLMDEPLSNLDAQLRVHMRAELAKLQRDLGVTTLYVTHDQVEAMTMGEQVAVMRAGGLQQLATPEELYSRPVNTFVARFIGSPAMNFLRVKIRRDAAGRVIATLASRPRVQVVHGSLPSEYDWLQRYEEQVLLLGVRPEDFHLLDPASDADIGVRGTLRLREVLGAEVYLYVDLDEVRSGPNGETDSSLDRTLADADDQPVGEPGDQPDSAVVVRAAMPSPLREGDALALAASSTRLYFFDPRTGVALY